MKTKTLLLLMAFASLFFVSCSDDDDDYEFDNVPSNVQDAFKKQYKNVKDVKWEQIKGYHVARFNQPITRAAEAKAYTSSAWYTTNGKHCQSNQEIEFAELPALVKDAFNAYKELTYPDWELDDCEVVCREDMAMIYIIEIELNDLEREISISEAGDIIKDVLDDDDEILPIIIPEEIKALLMKMYPENYNEISLLELEIDDDEIELDILEGKKHKELKLDINYNWVCTEYDLTYEEALSTIDAAIFEKIFTFLKENHNLDLKNNAAIQAETEIEVKEHKTKGISYEFEIEYGDDELEFTIDKDGNISEDED